MSNNTFANIQLNRTLDPSVPLAHPSQRRVYHEGATYHLVTPELLAWMAVRIGKALTIREHDNEFCTECSPSRPACKIMSAIAAIGKTILFYNRLRELTGLEPGEKPEPPRSVEFFDYFNGSGYKLGELNDV